MEWRVWERRLRSPRCPIPCARGEARGRRQLPGEDAGVKAAGCPVEPAHLAHSAGWRKWWAWPSLSDSASAGGPRRRSRRWTCNCSTWPSGPASMARCRGCWTGTWATSASWPSPPRTCRWPSRTVSGVAGGGRLVGQDPGSGLARTRGGRTGSASPGAHPHPYSHAERAWRWPAHGARPPTRAALGRAQNLPGRCGPSLHGTMARARSWGLVCL